MDEYWHAGYFYDLALRDLDRDGIREILLAGINNPNQGWGHPALAALTVPFGRGTKAARDEETKMFGVNGSHLYAYLVFPRPDVFQARKTGAFAAQISLLDTNRILVKSGSSFLGWMYYSVDSNLQLLDARPGSGIERNHEDCWRDKLLDHKISFDEINSWKRIFPFTETHHGA